MFRYALALLFITTYSSSSVIPSDDKDTSVVSPLILHQTNRSVVNALSSLLECKNPFLLTHIKAKLSECNLITPPFSEKEFGCLIFFDINRQLCNVVATSNLTFTENYYDSLINKPSDVEKVCDSAKDWTFGNLPEFPDYEKTVAMVFNTKITCIKVCGSDNVLSKDTNFYCKYYQWGYSALQTLQNKQNGLPGQEVPADGNSKDTEANNSALQNQIVPQGEIQPSGIGNDPDNAQNKMQDIPFNPDEHNNLPSSAIQNANAIPQGDVQGQSVTSQQEQPSSNMPASTVKNKKIEGNSTVKENQSTIANDKAKNNSVVDGSIGNSDLNVDIHHVPKEVPPVLGGEVVVQRPNADQDDKDQQVERNRKLGSNEDYDDNQVRDDSEDTDQEEIDDTGKTADTGKQNVNLMNNEKNAFETHVPYNNEKEYQSAYADDDNAHFFSFFLTSIILVVLIYVLYHNKNKVSKVFLGLLVEGRQPGRRRNSRGHAYRRLDTLEQAMSTNSAAPPSKIIY